MCRVESRNTGTVFTGTGVWKWEYTNGNDHQRKKIKKKLEEKKTVTKRSMTKCVIF